MTLVRPKSELQGRIYHKVDHAKCVYPTKKKRLTKAKKEGKGAYEGQNEDKRPFRNFSSAKNQIVPRVYESLNPALQNSVP